MITAQELINKRKETIRRHCRGYDSSLKLSGNNSFTGIINYLDKQNINSEVFNDISNTIKNKATAVLRIANMKAARTNNSRAIDWLNNWNNCEELFSSIREYTLLNATVFTIDDETIHEFTQLHKEDGMYKNIIRNAYKEDFYTEFLLKCKNTLYHLILPSIQSIENGYNEIQASVCICDGSEPMAVYNYKCAVLSLDDKMNPVAETENIKVMCSNKSCASYKACMAPAYEDGTKEVNCNPQLCDKCDAFKSDIMSPYKLLEAIKPVIYAYDNRTQSSRVINEGVPVHYEPLPLPESDKDIVIYSDTEHNNISTIKIVNHGADYIPGTHASPREHERKAHYRYNKKTGLKDIKVRSCIVNKGHTKTNYTVRNHTRNSIKEEVLQV